MIREADIDDAPAILRMCRDFLHASGTAIPWNAAYAQQALAAALVDPMTAVILLDTGDGPRGVLVASAAMHPFGPVLVGQELVWWIDPAARRAEAARAMLDGFEAWAGDLGCSMICLSHLADDRVAALYRRRGFRALETHMVKAL